MPKIFISYRRADANEESRLIYDALAARFGEDSIFRDKDRISKGVDFRKTIEQYVFDSDEMLVLIGRKWLDIRENDAPSERRLDNPEDFVRIEIDMGLRHVDYITPVVLHNANMPTEEELPRRLVQLSFQNAYFLRPNHFDDDLKQLVEDIANRHTTEDIPKSSTSHQSNRRLSIAAIVITMTFVLIGFSLVASGILSPTLPEETPTNTPNAVEIAAQLLTLTYAPTITQTMDATQTIEAAMQNLLITETVKALATIDAYTDTPSPTNTATFTTTPTMTKTSVGESTIISTQSTSTPTETSTPSNTPPPTVDVTGTAQVNINSTATQIALITQVFEQAVATENAHATQTVEAIPTTISIADMSMGQLIDLAMTPVTSNEDWIPIEREIDGVIMVLVPVGCFTFSTELNDDAPHCFESPFWIDQTEVTNGQYGSTGVFGLPTDSRSRDSVTWTKAKEFCEGKGKYLPTEEAWEYAARGPSGLEYTWIGDFDPNLAIYEANADQPVEVGTIPNGQSWVGAYDMVGNLWEWTSTNVASYRVSRGGSWGTGESALSLLSPENRLIISPNTSEPELLYLLGFRCARTVSDSE